MVSLLVNPIMDFMGRDLEKIIAALLPTDNHRLAAALRETMRPFVRDAFQRGLEVGINLAREGALKELIAVRGEFTNGFEGSTTIGQDRKPRISAGSIPALIEMVLTATPGLKAMEVEQRVFEYKPSVNRKSVGNDLRNQEGVRYRRDIDKLWYLIPAPAKASMASTEPEARLQELG
jgi:hypothetical protein